MLAKVFLRFPYRIFLLLFLSFSPILASYSPALLPCTESDPDAFIQHVVNVITGEYFEAAEDLSITAPSPLILQRFYSNRDYLTGTQPGGWRIFPERFLVIGKDRLKTSYSRAFTGGRSGGIFSFFGKINEEGFSENPLKIRIAQDAIGMCNTSTGEISGQTNHQNDLLHSKGNLCELLLGDGTRYIYEQVQNLPSDLLGEELIPVIALQVLEPKYYKLVQENLPNGNYLFFSYTEKGHLASIEMKNSKQSKILAWIRFTYLFNDSKCTLHITTSEEKTVLYHLEKVNGCYQLKEVFGSHIIPVCYEYTNGLLTRKNLPEGRYSEIEYYKDGKVKALKSPNSWDGHPEVTHSFSYESECTEVFNASNIKTSYRYNERKELSSIETYDNFGQPYRIDRKYFGKTPTDAGLLLAKTTEDSTGKIHSYRSFIYDPSGNIREERVYGNLTGNPNVFLEVNSEGLLLNPHEDECSIKKFTYSQDGFNLLIQIGDCKNNTTSLAYKPKTNLLAKKILCSNTEEYDYDDDPINHETKSFFYYYNEDAARTKIIETDGWAKEEKDIASSSRKKVTAITPKDTLPGVGLPLSTEEKIVDLQKKKEAFVKRHVNSYDNQCLCLSLDTYGSDGVHAFSEVWTYNHLGQVLTRVDGLGRVIKQSYDLLGNLEYISIPHENKTISLGYDLRNQPTSSIESRGDGVFSSHSSYDLQGRKNSSTDSFGNTTTYEYDFCDRVIKITHPTVWNEKEEAICPIFTYTYDIFNNVTSVTDPEGYVTHTSHNLRGDPTKITYQDGSFELFKYDPEGSLHRSLSREKIITVYEYDHLGRKSYKEVSTAGANGIELFLYGHRYTYNASYCIQEEITQANEDGYWELTKKYTYNIKGLLTLEDTTGDRSAPRQVQMKYDPLGRVNETRTRFSTKEKDYSVESFTHDLLRNILKKEISDSKGNVCLIKGFSYNALGQCILEYEDDPNKPSLQIIYDDHLEPKAYIDALGCRTQVLTNYFYKNALGQNVLKRTLINPLGTQVETEFDALQRVHIITKKEADGTLLSSQRNFYDLVGNLCREIHEEIVDGEIFGSKTIRRFYGPMGRLKEEIEAEGSLQENKTLFFYNSKGQLSSKQTKGITTSYYYTAQGLVRKIEVSDENKKIAISNTYQYDVSGNVTSAKALNDIEITRDYDGFNRLISESVSSAADFHIIKYSYDQKDRLTAITLPDKSKIIYTYDAVFGKKIERFSSEQKLLYAHTYDSYDLQGRILQETLVANLGSQDLRYDLLGNKTYICNPFYKEHCKRDALGRIYEVQTNDALSEYRYNGLSQLTLEKKTTSRTYIYDSLDRRIKIDGCDLTHNSLDRLLKISKNDSTKAELFYNSRGSLLRKVIDGNTTLLTNNFLQQLTSIKKNKNHYSFAYDPFGRIAVKRSFDDKGKQKFLLRYFYIGNEEIGSLGEANSIKTLKVLGINGNTLSQKAVAFELHNKLYVPLYDMAGNVAGLVNSNTKSVIERYEYTAFGEETIYNESGEKIENSSVNNPWRFVGKRNQEGLICFGLRFYDPELGRWTSPDPSGFVDGANRYAYLHNNPLNYFDRFGLASESRNDFEGYFYGDVENHCFCATHRTCKRGGDIRSSNAPPPKVSYNDRFESKHTISYGREKATYYEPSKIFDLSDLETIDSPNIGIGWINGINNTYAESRESALYLSKLSQGYNIHAVYNATHGASADVKEAKQGLKHIATTPVRLLHKLWNDFFDNSSEEATFLMICHSQGAIHVRNALLDYPPNLKSRITVVAVAPAAYIYRVSCAGATHYRASRLRDPIPRIDQQGAKREGDSIIELTSAPGAPFFDHPINSPTYQQDMLIRIAKYTKSSKRK
ncbi:MAG: RHS repeat-associated core domain-containing protein [Chlamydiota bacterium]